MTTITTAMYYSCVWSCEYESKFYWVYIATMFSIRQRATWVSIANPMAKKTKLNAVCVSKDNQSYISDKPVRFDLFDKFEQNKQKPRMVPLPFPSRFVERGCTVG